MRDISELVRSIQIENVRVVEASARTSLKADDEGGPIEARIARNAHISEMPDNGLFVVRVDFSFLGHRDGDKRARAASSAVVSISVSYELTYRIPTNMSTSTEALTEFAKANGVFNAWPYFREFVHSALARMGLPPFILPVYRLVQSRKAEPKDRREPAERSGALAGTR